MTKIENVFETLRQFSLRQMDIVVKRKKKKKNAEELNCYYVYFNNIGNSNDLYIFQSMQILYFHQILDKRRQNIPLKLIGNCWRFSSSNYNTLVIYIHTYIYIIFDERLLFWSQYIYQPLARYKLIIISLKRNEEKECVRIKSRIKRNYGEISLKCISRVRPDERRPSPVEQTTHVTLEEITR